MDTYYVTGCPCCPMPPRCCDGTTLIPATLKITLSGVVSGVYTLTYGAPSRSWSLDISGPTPIPVPGYYFPLGGIGTLAYYLSDVPFTGWSWNYTTWYDGIGFGPAPVSKDLRLNFAYALSCPGILSIQVYDRLLADTPDVFTISTPSEGYLYPGGIFAPFESGPMVNVGRSTLPSGLTTAEAAYFSSGFNACSPWKEKFVSQQVPPLGQVWKAFTNDSDVYTPLCAVIEEV